MELKNYSVKELFVEIFSRMLKEQHEDWSEQEIHDSAEDGYDNSDDEIEEAYRRVNEMSIECHEDDEKEEYHDWTKD